MGGFNFLNIEYLLTRVYDFFGGFHAGDLFGALPSWFSFLTTQIAIWGMVITLLMVLLIVYTQIRLVMVENEGFHGKEEHQVHKVEGGAPPAQNQRWAPVIEPGTPG